MRLFVAVWPSAAVVDELRGLERPARPGVRWTTADQWHVTLRFLGEMEDPDLLTSRMEELTWPGRGNGFPGQTPASAVQGRSRGHRWPSSDLGASASVPPCSACR